MPISYYQCIRVRFNWGLLHAANDKLGFTSEIIVVDNNSTDNTANLAAGAQVVFEPINQIGRARNAGAAVAVGDWLLFVGRAASGIPGVL